MSKTRCRPRMLSHVISIPLIAPYSTYAALQLPQSPLLPCRRNISFPANSYPLKHRKFHISAPLRCRTRIRKTIRFIMAVLAEHRIYNNTLYSNLEE